MGATAITAIAGRAPLKKLIDRLHIPLHLFLSGEDDHDVRDVGKHDFRFLVHPMLSNANLLSAWS